MPKLTITVLPTPLCIHRLARDTDIPAVVLRAAWFSVTRTDDELSIVLPAEVAIASEHREGDWIALQVAGPLGFALVGILAGIASALAAARISISVTSTYDTDFILVKQDRLADAVRALRAADYEVIE